LRTIATDKDEARLNDLRAAFGASKQVNVVAIDELEQWAGGADLVVTDVPCSNSGVLARRAEAKYRLTDKSLAQLASLQREIVTNAMRLLKPGGLLLYSTCSLEPAENSEQIAWMVRQFGMEPVRAESRFPRGLPGEPMSRYADGGFACLLRRQPGSLV
jgi:16S rRNA (cytosine967-C5)-methyltransferase